MPAHALPLNLAPCLGQRRRREPPHTETQRQRIPDDQAPRLAPLHMAQRTRAIGSPGIQHAAIVRVYVVFRRRVQQHIQVRADVQVAELQGAGQREHQGYVLHLVGLLADRLDVLWRARGQAAGERRVGVDVELEEVEEGVVDHGHGAVQLFLDAVVELERLVGLFAGGEGDPLDLVVFGVLDVFACFSVWVY